MPGVRTPHHPGATLPRARGARSLVVGAGASASRGRAARPGVRLVVPGLRRAAPSKHGPHGRPRRASVDGWRARAARGAVPIVQLASRRWPRGGRVKSSRRSSAAPPRTLGKCARGSGDPRRPGLLEGMVRPPRRGSRCDLGASRGCWIGGPATGSLSRGRLRGAHGPVMHPGRARWLSPRSWLPDRGPLLGVAPLARQHEVPHPVRSSECDRHHVVDLEGPGRVAAVATDPVTALDPGAECRGNSAPHPDHQLVFLLGQSPAARGGAIGTSDRDRPGLREEVRISPAGQAPASRAGSRSSRHGERHPTHPVTVAR